MHNRGVAAVLGGLTGACHSGGIANPANTASGSYFPCGALTCCCHVIMRHVAAGCVQVHKGAKLLDVLGAVKFEDMLDVEEEMLEAQVKQRHWWQR